MKTENPALQAAIDWMKTPEAQIQIGKLFLKGFEDIEDYENCAIVKNNIERLEKQILDQRKN